MRLQFTERFRRAFADLSDADAARVRKALRLLTADPRYPGLRVKRVQGTDGISEARASDAIRITFEMHGDTLLLRMVGAHDPTLKNP
jgi:mRNA-degrading endonuclease RelE of RelBE toxin-antitoxin system